MTATDQTAAHEDLALFVGDRLPTAGTDWPTVDKTLAALLDGGHIREDWGVRWPDAVSARDTWGYLDRTDAENEMARSNARCALIRSYVITTAATVVEEG